MEFTGDYSRCSKCGYIYDYNDSCPECGSNRIVQISASEVKMFAKLFTDEAAKRMHEMLELHDDN